MKDFFSKNKRAFPVIVMLSILTGMGLIAWFGIRPFQGFITEKADSIQEYYATRENRNQQMSKLPDLQQQFEAIQAEEDVLDILLSEERIVDFVRTLERLASETGVQVVIQAKSGNIIEEKGSVKKSVQKPAAAGIDESTEGGTAKKKELSIMESLPFDRYLHVEVVVKGEYQTIVAFLHKMETLPLALDVVAMTMKVRDEDEQVSRADNPGRNPFLLLSGSEIIPVIPDEKSLIMAPGTLEASFDTVVYLDNE